MDQWLQKSKLPGGALKKQKVAAPPLPLSEEQQAVVASIRRGESTFFTGSAGTGKSFTLRAIIKALNEEHRGRGVYVTASTGAAATQVCLSPSKERGALRERAPRENGGAVPRSRAPCPSAPDTGRRETRRCSGVDAQTGRRTNVLHLCSDLSGRRHHRQRLRRRRSRNRRRGHAGPQGAASAPFASRLPTAPLRFARLIKAQVGANRYAAKRWKDCRALVIDEISMIDAGEAMPTGRLGIPGGALVGSHRVKTHRQACSTSWSTWRGACGARTRPLGECSSSSVVIFCNYHQ
ncbi:P-loop containing nucleoside triphosphate hydrolase protein [Pelagophyceae sp. CCMP2097]|nr:P-loop containing nucleoside triphosphate hydrolase protein [Pelagophyceae sp. CCMP2097]